MAWPARWRKASLRRQIYNEVCQRPLLKALEDVLAFRDFPAQNRRKAWSTNLLERVNVAPKRVLSSAVITRLVEAVLLEQEEHWQLKGRRMFSAESMAAIPR